MLPVCTSERKGSLVDLEENADRYVRIWKFPKFDRHYVVGADVAEGLEKGDSLALMFTIGR